MTTTIASCCYSLLGHHYAWQWWIPVAIVVVLAICLSAWLDRRR